MNAADDRIGAGRLWGIEIAKAVEYHMPTECGTMRPKLAFWVCRIVEEGLLFFPQKITMGVVESLLQGVEGVDEHVFRQCATMDDALCLPTYLFFDAVLFLIRKYNLYERMRIGWS